MLKLESYVRIEKLYTILAIKKFHSCFLSCLLQLLRFI